MLGVALVVFTAGIGVAYAATVSQDVTLQVTAPGGGSTRNVTLKSGSSFDSLTVSGSTMAFSLSGSQSVSLTSSSLDFNNDQNVSSSCGSLTVTASQASTINIETGGNCSGGGGGGGGGYTPYTPPSPPATTTPEPEPSTTESTPSSSSSSSAEPTPSTIPPPSSVSTETTPTTPVQTVSFPIPSTELELGMENDEVTKLQELLASEPEIYPEGRVTGYFGELTRAAIRRFQERHGLPPVGRVGPLTLQKLTEVYGNVTLPPAPQVTEPTTQAPLPLPPVTYSQSGSVPIPTAELDLGMESIEVAKLQVLLAKDSSIYPGGSVTGYFGADTFEAVKRFQARYGLPTVGRVGSATLAKLKEVFDSE
ncbi:MAG: NLP/P60 protein [Candidatus Giovannonibacteria bacterium GW2011_GWB1_47_6b]|uniref:NLP/P60 protein n=1 Tax=Candidatus Giovannonibacteria bacterium GW2011_GWB1_47_6b TaxID=1618655 RepID=A0A0G1VE45_9BACT|nr:MAG: NLP/P60 protein [Candidatus Giovannonibacteria bacterium GW2011_GWB1_47_6b]